MERNEMAALIVSSMLCAIEEDGQAASAALNVIGNNGTRDDMYAACSTFAEAARYGLAMALGDVDAAAGEMLTFEELQPGANTAASQFAMRFITAHANGDEDTTLALFLVEAEAGGTRFSTAVVELLAHSARFARLAFHGVGSL